MSEDLQTKRYVIIGKSGSGKTYFCRENIIKPFIKQKQDKGEYILICDTRNDELADELITTDTFFEKIPQIIEKYKNLHSQGKTDHEAIIVFDDVLNTRITHSNIMNTLFASGRHYGFHLVFICQTASIVVSQLIYNNMTDIVIFKLSNIYHLGSLCRNFLSLEINPEKNENQLIMEKKNEILNKTKNNFCYFHEEL